jgi:hypothetical protein
MQKLAKANARQLDVLMPNIRGMTGFAAALKNAEGLGRDYQYMLSDVNMVEHALAIEEETMRSQLDKSREAWNQMKRDIGEQIAPSIVNLTVLFTDNTSAWGHCSRH